MKLFIKYVGFLYIKYFLIVFFALELFYVGIDFLTNIDKIPNSANLKLLYVSLTMLVAVNYILSLSLVLAFIVTIVNLIRSNELVSFYALGISRNALIMPFFAISLLVVFLYILIQATPFAYAREYQKYLMDTRYKSDISDSIFLKFEDKFIYIDKIYFNQNLAKNIVIFETKDGVIKNRIYGDEAKFDGTNWIISDAINLNLPANFDLNSSGYTISHEQSLKILNNFNSKTIQNAYQTTGSYSIIDTIKSIALLSKEKINISKLKSTLYYMLFFPLFAPIMLVIIYYFLPLVGRFTNLALASFACVIITLGVWGMLFVLSRFSQNGVIAPELGIILPIVILASFAGFKFYKNA